MLKNVFYCVVLSLGMAACGGSASDNPDKVNDNFDRKKMLIYWADQMIIPAYKDFSKKSAALKSAAYAFTQSPTAAGLANLRTAWETAYIAWQRASPYQVGKAEALQMDYQMNTYPTNTADLKTYLMSQNYDLNSQNLHDEQGFPAIDYLIYGLSADQAALIGHYTDTQNGEKYKKYLNALSDRIATLSAQVVADWEGGYRSKFIEKNQSSVTSSVDKMVNYYIVKFYERQLRENKIGTPSGARTGVPVADKVEAYYKKNLSKRLFDRTLQVAEDFFEGKSFDGTQTGTSLRHYLTFLKRDDLVSLIRKQFADIKTTAAALNDNFALQIEKDNTKMTRTFDKLQVLVKSLKVDMASAMSIKITIADNDGD